MKYITLFSFFLVASIGFAQEANTPCNQLPVAAPEKIAVYDGDIEKFFASSLNEELKKGTHTAVFKMMVDCDGVVQKPRYERGNFSDTDQKDFLKLLSEMKWKPATNKSVDVTSTVFISIEIVNGQVAVKLQ